jgi:hypothetical protein
VVLLLALVVPTVGCNPAFSLYYFIMPEPRTPPDRALTCEGRESKVVVMATNAGMELRTELFSADQDLVQGLCNTMQKRFAENGEKVKFVPPYQVKNYLGQQTSVRTPYEVGKHFKADYVVCLEIASMSLYKKGSANTLYFGTADIHLSVTDMSAPREEGPVWDTRYACEYPKSGEDTADSMPVGIFRARFLNRMATDMARYFTTSRTSDKFD